MEINTNQDHRKHYWRAQPRNRHIPAFSSSKSRKNPAYRIQEPVLTRMLAFRLSPSFTGRCLFFWSLFCPGFPPPLGCCTSFCEGGSGEGGDDSDCNSGTWSSCVLLKDQRSEFTGFALHIEENTGATYPGSPDLLLIGPKGRIQWVCPTLKWEYYATYFLLARASRTS